MRLPPQVPDEPFVYGDSQGYFVVLEQLRSIAATAVLTRRTDAYFRFAFFESYLAVDFFFVLSGLYFDLCIWPPPSRAELFACLSMCTSV
jgi:hypothetical protein